MKILMLLTGIKELTLRDGQKYSTGFWAEEFAVPYKKFKNARYEIEIATVGGIVPVPDESSLTTEGQSWVRPKGTYRDDAAKVQEYKKIIDEALELRNPRNVQDFTKDNMKKYAGIYFVGGHGCLGDMAGSESMGSITIWAKELNIPIAAVCHGHCGLIKAVDDDGNWIFKGYDLTCFSHDEEKTTSLYKNIPFILKDRLKKLGGKYSKSPIMWGSYVIVDRNLITGQNPYSSVELADVFLKSIEYLKEIKEKSIRKPARII
jgi:putative intracellular protease/amidase